MTPTEIDRLENRKSFVRVNVTEDNVEEDVNFQNRWPAPIDRVTTYEVIESSLPIPRLMKITIPNPNGGPGLMLMEKP